MSLRRGDWLKLLAGAALLATGAGAAGIGPLAAAMGGAGAAGAGAGAVGAGAGLGAAGAGLGAAGTAAGGTAAKAGFGALLKTAAANSAMSTGMGMGASAIMPQTGMTTPGNVPQMSPPDITAQLQELMKRRGQMRAI